MPELCWEHGISSASFYKWRAKFGGMDESLMTRLREPEDENFTQNDVQAPEAPIAY